MAVNNYDQWRVDWQRRFLSMDKVLLLRKLPFLRISGDRLLVPYFQCQKSQDLIAIIPIVEYNRRQ